MKIAKLLLLGFIISMLFLSFNNASGKLQEQQTVSTVYPLALIDDYGRNVTITEAPETIISIAPSATEVIFAVGAGEKIIAVDSYSNYPLENTTNLPKIATYPALDIEAILSYDPDLVFGAGITSQDDVTLMENQGITVFILAPFDLEEVLLDIENVGKITNHVSNANVLLNSLNSRISAVNQSTSALAYKPKVYIETLVYSGYSTFGKGTYGHDIIELAGGINIAENATGQYPSLNSEFIIIQNPDLILYNKGDWTTTNASIISNRTGWSVIKAVKTGNIYPINEDWMSRGGPRIVDALEEISSRILAVAGSSSPSSTVPSFSWINLVILSPCFILLSKRMKRRKN
ncbi:MAG: ABC transporter substrate-binding protein [Candidatus Hodarchaeales archaeon]